MCVENNTHEKINVIIDKNEQNNESNSRLADKKDIIKNKSRNKDKQVKVMSSPDIPKSLKLYPINFMSNKENKIYLSLSKNKREAMIKDCQVNEVYDQIKFMLENDIQFVGAVLIGLINRYITEFAGKAKNSNHMGVIQETFDTLSAFSYHLELYTDGLIPLHLKGIDPSLIFMKQMTIENNIENK